MADGERKSFLRRIGGDTTPRRMTLERFVQNIPDAAVSCVVNGGGGVVSGIVKTTIEEKWAGYGLIGVALISIALKAGFQPTSDLNVAVRELAGGMAGGIGNEAWEAVYVWWTYSKWEPNKPYKHGTKVKHNGVPYEANADIEASLTAEPGKDARWKAVAQAMPMANVALLAQAFVEDKDRVQTISDYLAKAIGERRNMSDAEKSELSHEVRTAMNLLGKTVAEG
jgi:hypothetical protein